MKKYNNFYEVEMLNGDRIKVTGSNIQEVKNNIRKMSIPAFRIRRLYKIGGGGMWEKFWKPLDKSLKMWYNNNRKRERNS